MLMEFHRLAEKKALTKDKEGNERFVRDIDIKPAPVCLVQAFMARYSQKHLSLNGLIRVHKIGTRIKCTSQWQAELTSSHRLQPRGILDTALNIM